jgi:hypothetical protein
MKLFDGGRTTVKLTRKQSVLGVGVARGVLGGLMACPDLAVTRKCCNRIGR